MYIMDDYDRALRLILDKGVWKSNRTGVRSKSVFGIMSRYDISDRFPIVTGRKVWPKSIWAELLWVISGSSNNKDLQALGSNIWTPWVDDGFEKENYYAPGSLGPVYGFQLRHFNGNYGNGNSEQIHLGENLYGRGGVDQLENVIRLLKENPDDRRIIFSLWNPAQLKQMRLPPCHLYFQAFVHDGKLSGLMMQRSCDFPVGVPANIQFYSSLIYMLAQQTGFTPHEFIHVTNDSHIYEDQVPAVEEYLSRKKPDSPRLILRKANSIYSYILEDFSLLDYSPLDVIKVPVTV